MNKRMYFNRQRAGSVELSPLTIPRFLISADTPAHAELTQMSNNAKMLYALLLDRLCSNEASIAFLEKPWHNNEKQAPKPQGGYDENGHAYAYFSFEEIMEQLTLSMEGAEEVLAELEEYAMIELALPETATNKFLRIYPLTPVSVPASASATKV